MTYAVKESDNSVAGKTRGGWEKEKPDSMNTSTLQEILKWGKKGPDHIRGKKRPEGVEKSGPKCRSDTSQREECDRTM